MTNRTRIPTAALAGLLASAALGAPATSSTSNTGREARPPKAAWRIESWEGQQELPAGGVFTVHNAHGNVHARRSERPRAEVYGVIQRHAEDPRRARIDMHAEPGGVVAEVHQPADEALAKPSTWAFRRVDLTVYVPEGAPWRVTTGAGRIDARRLRSEVEASTVSGDIVLILSSGGVNASSESGDVKVALNDVAWVGERRIESQSGELSVTVPDGVDLDLVIDTRGEVDLDGAAPAAARARAAGDAAGPIHLRLGSGGRTLLLRSATGKISFRSLDRHPPSGTTRGAKEG